MKTLPRVLVCLAAMLLAGCDKPAADQVRILTTKLKNATEGESREKADARRAQAESRALRIKVSELELEVAKAQASASIERGKPINEARDCISRNANEIAIVRRLAAVSCLVADQTQSFEGLPLHDVVALDIDFIDSKWEYAMKKYHEALGDPKTSEKDRIWASGVVTKVEATRREIAAMGYPPKAGGTRAPD